MARKKARIRCATGKISHDSEEAAHGFIKLLKLRYGEIIEDSLSPYICRACGDWHIGRSKKCTTENPNQNSGGTKQKVN